MTLQSHLLEKNKKIDRNEGETLWPQNTYKNNISGSHFTTSPRSKVIKSDSYAANAKHLIYNKLYPHYTNNSSYPTKTKNMASSCSAV